MVVEAVEVVVVLWVSSGLSIAVVVVVFFFLAAVDFAAVFFAAIKALLRNLNELI